MTRILHVLDHSLPAHSGYTFRTRALMKAMLTGEEAVLRLIPALLEASAECLRRGQAPPWGLRDMLGGWLTQRMRREPE